MTQTADTETGVTKPEMVTLTIDGVDNTDEFSGSSRTELSLEVVREFQVVQNGWLAENAGAALEEIAVNSAISSKVSSPQILATRISRSSSSAGYDPVAVSGSTGTSASYSRAFSTI